jgi:hypothetical protein
VLVLEDAGDRFLRQSLFDAQCSKRSESGAACATEISQRKEDGSHMQAILMHKQKTPARH